MEDRTIIAEPESALWVPHTYYGTLDGQTVSGTMNLPGFHGDLGVECGLRLLIAEYARQTGKTFRQVQKRTVIAWRRL